MLHFNQPNTGVLLTYVIEFISFVTRVHVQVHLRSHGDFVFGDLALTMVSQLFLLVLSLTRNSF